MLGAPWPGPKTLPGRWEFLGVIQFQHLGAGSGHWARQGTAWTHALRVMLRKPLDGLPATPIRQWQLVELLDFALTAVLPCLQLGLLGGGLADGSICIWNPARIVGHSAQEASKGTLLCRLQKHQGAVRNCGSALLYSKKLTACTGSCSLAAHLT